MNALEKQEYLIGDIASITGLSRDTLRFYEKKGILTARKKSNGYRYFTEDDLYLLVRILFSKKLNLGLDAIEDLMVSAPLDGEHKNALSRQMEAEIKAIRFHQQTLSRLISIKKIYEELEERRDCFSLRSFPPCRILYRMDSAVDGLKQWFSLSQKYSGLDMVYVYDCYRYQSGFSLQDAQLTYECSQLLIYEDVVQCMEPEYDFFGCEILEESAPCICTVADGPEAKPSLSVIGAMRQWAAKQGLVASPEVFFTSNFAGVSDKGYSYYQEIYIPVISS